MLLEYIGVVLDWCKQKIILYGQDPDTIFKEGEIWWAHVGMNIGTEIYGKNKSFSRPVLILRKFSKNGFLGIPLTSKKKEGSWFVAVIYGGKESAAILNQVRTFDKKRLISRVGVLSEPHFDEVRSAFHVLICK